MKLYLASGNAHKAQEMNTLAAAAGIGLQIVSAREVGGMPPVVEDTGTFAGNATKKARALKAKLPEDTWVLSDDSGICVDALDGAPGVESAYFAGPMGDSAANLKKLVEVMRGVPSERRGAHFMCVLVLCGPADEEHVFVGRCDGTLLNDPQGGGGFGYDPLFVPVGETDSYAELGEDIKNATSHRAKAWANLVAWWRTHHV